MIVSVDLGFELCMALSYAYDQPENRAGLMKLAPRKPVPEESVRKLRAKALQKSNVEQGDSLWAKFKAFFKGTYSSIK